MRNSKIALGKWAIAIYLMSTNLKRMSRMKCHRELRIRQASARKMAQRKRQGWNRDRTTMSYAPAATAPGWQLVLHEREELLSHASAEVIELITVKSRAGRMVQILLDQGTFEAVFAALFRAMPRHHVGAGQVIEVVLVNRMAWVVWMVMVQDNSYVHGKRHIG